jgi:hypothetical protein
MLVHTGIQFFLDAGFRRNDGKVIKHFIVFCCTKLLSLKYNNVPPLASNMVSGFIKVDNSDKGHKNRLPWE